MHSPFDEPERYLCAQFAPDQRGNASPEGDKRRKISRARMCGSSADNYPLVADPWLNQVLDRLN